MGSDGVVVVTPLFDQDLGLSEAAEYLPVEQLVPQLAVEAFAIAILPGAAWPPISALGYDDYGSRFSSHFRRCRGVANRSVCYPLASQQTLKVAPDSLLDGGGSYS